MSTPASIVVFTRDLRVHDHPSLAAAHKRGGPVVPTFVFDDAILASSFNRPNRTGFMLESLADLDSELKNLGARLILRRGNWVDEILKLAHRAKANAIYIAEDVSRLSRQRLDKLEAAANTVGVEVIRQSGITVIPAGAVAPPDSDHYKVFTPYYRRWQEIPWRPIASTPKSITPVVGLKSLPLPKLSALCSGTTSPEVIPGGETQARKRLDAWTKKDLANYSDRHDDLPGDATSRISPYLHFGCLSSLEVATKLRARAGGEAFVRQICWRDFYAQILAARPDAGWSDFKDRGDRWNQDSEAFAAWVAGRTGFPVVDAGMRQLVREGFMHNRARMVVASFLTKDLYQDWRKGAAHFLDWLVDGDLANNNLNWQWNAGTGTDTNPHRIFNPTRQGNRFDAQGDYVRRYVEELSEVEGGLAQDPDPETRARVGYPLPIVDHQVAIAEYKEMRATPQPPS